MSAHFCTKIQKKFVDFLSFSGLRGKFFQFFLCQFPKFAGRECFIQPEATQPQAFQRRYRAADCRNHALDLMIFALFERHTHAQFRFGLEDFQLRRLAFRAVPQSCPVQTQDCIRCQRAVHDRLVLLFDMAVRTHQRMAERAVVRDEQQSLGVLVQPSHRKQPRRSSSGNSSSTVSWRSSRLAVITPIGLLSM